MAAPLASNYREQPLWQAQSPLPETPTETLPTTADAVIVGGGYCGLAAATELARRGRHAVVIEREQLGWGASTRSDGMVIPELKANLTALRQE